MITKIFTIQKHVDEMKCTQAQMKEETNQMKETMSQIERKQDRIKVRKNSSLSKTRHFETRETGLILCDQRRQQNFVVVHMTCTDCDIGFTEMTLKISFL